MKKMIFVSLLAVALSGCATQQQMIGGFESAAAVSLRAAEDNNLKVLVFSLCATPLSAAIRHPEAIPGLRSLCLPGGADTSPYSLLESVPAVPILTTNGSLAKP